MYGPHIVPIVPMVLTFGWTQVIGQKGTISAKMAGISISNKEIEKNDDLDLDQGFLTDDEFQDCCIDLDQEIRNENGEIR